MASAFCCRHQIQKGRLVDRNRPLPPGGPGGPGAAAGLKVPPGKLATERIVPLDAPHPGCPRTNGPLTAARSGPWPIPGGLRHALAAEWVREGQPMPLLRGQLGHSSLAVTYRNPRDIAPWRGDCGGTPARVERAAAEAAGRSAPYFRSWPVHNDNAWDVGVALGVSYQRAHQLVDEAKELADA
jgi:hypothetical protein